ncbi:transketolase [Sciscionella sediminilitoris]|uniref:transketolase n=1 Tax=Sciscionella sediminilitoris TaxID=1445613 RepID=UPI0004DF7D1F|nr:transketolase [Sciscionella sp. SE31]
MNREEFRTELAAALRVDSVRCSTTAGSGHPTSSMSAADLLAVLLDGHFRRDLADPCDLRGDELIFSKGHASPLYYAVLKALGLVTDEELLTFRELGSRLEGHPTPRAPMTHVATGSLGQGLPIGVGVALAARDLERLPEHRTWVLCGDSELAEGSVWEAFAHAGWRHLHNLTALVDTNRLGQTRQTMLGWDMDAYAERARSFGWRPIVVDGHDLGAIDEALTEATRTEDRPTVVFAKTRKGRGVAAVEDQPGKHGKPLDEPEQAVTELGGKRDVQVRPRVPETAEVPRPFPVSGGDRGPRWDLEKQVATRTAYGEALTALAAERGDVLALDGEVSNSTKSEIFAAAYPERYFEMFIAEQQMVGAAVGMQTRGWVPFASSFAAFLSRAADFIRMAAISRAQLCLVGSHAGVAIGQDGPSQMALEDIAMLRAVPGSVVLHPSDANQTAALVPALAEHRGIGYLRTLRGATTVRTAPEEPICVGGSRIVRRSPEDTITLIGTGTTVDECERAAQTLAAHGIAARVLDCYSVKPIDADAVHTAAEATGALVTVEDHRPQGGLGDAVLEVLAESAVRPVVRKLAVRSMPMSGQPGELLAEAGIDAAGIVEAAESLVGQPV